MKIAVTADGKSLDSKVAEEFEECLYLLIVNMEDLNITAIKNDNLSESSSGEKLGNEVLKYDCEALITGKIRPLAFDKLADACVTRYFGIGNSVQNAIELMKNRSLKLLRNYDGTEKCDGHHN